MTDTYLSVVQGPSGPVTTSLYLTTNYMSKVAKTADTLVVNFSYASGGSGSFCSFTEGIATPWLPCPDSMNAASGQLCLAAMCAASVSGGSASFSAAFTMCPAANPQCGAADSVTSAVVQLKSTADLKAAFTAANAGSGSSGNGGSGSDAAPAGASTTAIQIGVGCLIVVGLAAFAYLYRRKSLQKKREEEVQKLSEFYSNQSEAHQFERGPTPPSKNPNLDYPGPSQKNSGNNRAPTSVSGRAPSRAPTSASGRVPVGNLVDTTDPSAVDQLSPVFGQQPVYGGAAYNESAGHEGETYEYDFGNTSGSSNAYAYPPATTTSAPSSNDYHQAKRAYGGQPSGNSRQQYSPTSSGNGAMSSTGAAHSQLQYSQTASSTAAGGYSPTGFGQYPGQSPQQQYGSPVAQQQPTYPGQAFTTQPYQAAPQTYPAQAQNQSYPGQSYPGQSYNAQAQTYTAQAYPGQAQAYPGQQPQQSYGQAYPGQSYPGQ
ncbi:hypothetical protein HDU79_005336 [Rhizoclosmatium sp. JEL0117]|nr:hypothetical protein HDU79_005336 [Rhizoclosmatium sp. JEL0117]